MVLYARLDTQSWILLKGRKSIQTICKSDVSITVLNELICGNRPNPDQAYCFVSVVLIICFVETSHRDVRITCLS